MTEVPATAPLSTHDIPGPSTGHEDHAHVPHLAHHFDTMEQQYDSGKLGMWVFLGTELLMFGGLFCAYAVYRANHPEVFIYAHTFLNTTWGAINTSVLLASSLTMAWAVRCSQLNQKKALVALLFATLVGGAGFMCIKAIEYNHKFGEDLGPGRFNQYNLDYKGNEEYPGMTNAAGMKKLVDEVKAAAPAPLPMATVPASPAQPTLYFDPNASNSTDHAKITPRFTLDSTLAAGQVTHTADEITAAKPDMHDTEAEEEHNRGIEFVDMNSNLSRQRINTFFGIYYCMTGLHGVHVIVGMSLIYWIMWRAANSKQRTWIPPLPVLAIGAYMLFIYGISHKIVFMWIGLPIVAIGIAWMALRFLMAPKRGVIEDGEFNSGYFAPVDLIGLYWHIVDLIWIFLFPLLYLIHGKVGS